jgi:hypothetical protein
MLQLISLEIISTVAKFVDCCAGINEKCSYFSKYLRIGIFPRRGIKTHAFR